MRIFGLKLLPVFLASLAVYVVGMLIYGLLFAQQWMALAGYNADSFKGQEWRMVLSPVMPILITLGIGLLIKDRGITTWMAGAKLGALVGVFFLISSRLYGFVYGTEPLALLAMDSAHVLFNGIVAGAILGAMKAAD